MEPFYLLILGGWVLFALLLYALTTRWRELARLRTRLGTGQSSAAPRIDTRDVSEIGPLERWLALAGFRAPGSSTTFILASVLCAALAVGGLLYFTRPGVIDGLMRQTLALPPAVADLLVPMLALAPYLLGLLLLFAPYLVVNGARKRRVLEIERELPILLDLLATLSESGLGFDSALNQVIEAETRESALIDEISQFQLESMAGVARTRCFRRLADRVRVGSMSIFCSAMVQADQVGAGFSGVLRQQADDLRNRRRERALILAQSLPVKLVFPLVSCFLPGIFMVTLGPAFHQFVQYADSMLSGR
jgi:tight adherence protein C